LFLFAGGRQTPRLAHILAFATNERVAQIGAGAFDERHQFFDDFGVLAGDVRRLSDIFFEIVERKLLFLSYVTSRLAVAADLFEMLIRMR
jgi:hypothetical protein